jgi:recombinational DNA repair protein (RecF pathway)
MADETKTCTRCGRTLPIEAFRPRAPHKVSRYSWCIECMLAHRRERYATDPEFRERVREHSKEQYRRERG